MVQISRVDRSRLDAVAPLWKELHAHHADGAPQLTGVSPFRGADDSWQMRQAQYREYLAAELPAALFLADLERGAAAASARYGHPMVDPVERLRALCLALPEVIERNSHGEPGWFVRGKKQFVALDDHHHGADHLAFWCAAPPGAQQELVAADPDQFFRPPYVGHRGWLGVRIDGQPDWPEIGEIVREAYRQVAAKSLLEQLR